MALFNIPERIIRPVLPVLPSIRTVTDDTYRDVKALRGVQAIKCNAFLPTRRQPVIRYRKGNYRRILQSSIPLEGLCVSPKPFPLVDSFRVTRQFESPMTKYPEYLTGAPKKSGTPHVQNTRRPFVESDKATSKRESVSFGYYTSPRSVSEPSSRYQNSRCAYKFDTARGKHGSMTSLTSCKPRTYPMYLTGRVDKVVAPSFQNSRRSYAQQSDKETGGQPSVTSFGKRVGKLDAANEQGHFHQVNQSKLEKLKQFLAGKEKLKEKEEAKDSKDDKA